MERSETETPKIWWSVLGGEAVAVNLAGVVASVLRMWALSVILLDKIADAVAQFLGGIVLIDINIFAFQGSESPLNDHIVHPSRLAIHALADLVILSKAGISLACKLAALV